MTDKDVTKEVIVNENAALIVTLVDQARARLERATEKDEDAPAWMAQAIERLERASALGAGDNVAKALAANTTEDALAALNGEKAKPKSKDSKKE